MNRSDFNRLITVGLLAAFIAFAGPSLDVRMATVHAACADQFTLDNGTVVEGTLLNPNESPRTTYVVGLRGGVSVKIPSGQVKRVDRQRPVILEYNRLRVDSLDTVNGNLAMAEWCRENYLGAQQDQHLERVLELEPDHSKARASLGFTKRGGIWTRQEDEMKTLGYVQYKGKWMLPQEVRLIEQQESYAKSEGEWRKNIRLWRSQLGTRRTDEAQENLSRINDPVAVTPLEELLRKEGEEKVRDMILTILHRINSPSARGVIARWSCEEPYPDLREDCFEYLADDPAMLDFYIRQLYSDDPDQINNAALAIQRLDGKRAIPDLMNRLISTHEFIREIGPTGNAGGSFRTDGSGGGMIQGKTSAKVIVHNENEGVRDALIKLSGGIDMGFNIAKWRAWWSSKRQLASFNPRRG